MKDLDIKKVWNTDEERIGGSIDEQKVDDIIEKGSVNLISKFIKTLKYEMWLNLFAFSGGAAWLYYRGKWQLGTPLLAIDILYFFYYQKLIRTLSEKTIDANVLEYLRMMYQIIVKFIVHYKNANLILAVPFFMLGMYIAKPDIFSLDFFSDGWTVVMILSAFTVAILLFYVLVYLLYGKKANKIRMLIEELSQEESDS